MWSPEILLCMDRQLMQGAADHVEAAEEEALDPVKVLRAGHAQVQSLPGSCTACVAVMHPEGELQVCTHAWNHHWGQCLCTRVYVCICVSLAASACGRHSHCRR